VDVDPFADFGLLVVFAGRRIDVSFVADGLGH
jgi:hypothetical protein